MLGRYEICRFLGTLNDRNNKDRRIFEISMHVRCPHCRNPIELVDEGSLSEIGCPSCGSSFSLVDTDETLVTETAKSVGHFELREPLGMGAFGTVWKAHDTELDRTVAVKIPRRGQLNAEEAEKFLREARAAAQLKHPSIVSVHEVGREDDTVYIVSDCIDGLTLTDWLTGQQPTPREAAELCVKIAEALHHAHEKGVIHRDLKPGNIMLDRDSEPHIMDFGLAKREAGEITMTLDGQILGTPAYMSPEQAGGDSHGVGPRADIYSLGVILFELLTGERPFRGNTRMLIHQVLTEDAPSPRKLNSVVPRDLETICLKCLRREPDRRYDTCLELTEDLTRWLYGKPIEARPVSRIEKARLWCRRKPTVAGSIAAILVTAIIVAGFIRAERNRSRLARIETNVDAMTAALGDSTPVVIRVLEGFPRDLVSSELRERFETADDTQKLPLAYALAHFGEAPIETIVSSLIAENTSSAEMTNIVTALRLNQQDALAYLKDTADEMTVAELWPAKSRCAIAALHLGDVSIAAEMLQAFPEAKTATPDEPLKWDPIQRTTFIEEFPAWSGCLNDLSDVIGEADSPEFRSGLSLALGSLPPPDDADVATALGHVLRAWCVAATDSGTHSAAIWALEQWGQELPELPVTDQPPSDRDWWHAPHDLRLVRIPAGAVASVTEVVRVDKDIWLSDRETTVGLFQQFMADADYEGLKPPNWEGPYEFRGLSAESQRGHPIQQVSWYDAVMFCNWLSTQHKYEPCYEITPLEEKDQHGETQFSVTWQRFANGFRLPSGAEWEYACRALTSTRYCFGDAVEMLEDYGVYDRHAVGRGTAATGSLKCNGWGLFDMHGNVFEWCWDVSNSFDDGPRRVTRGGGWSYPYGACSSTVRSFSRSTNRLLSGVGFRVLRSSVESSKP